MEVGILFLLLFLKEQKSAFYFRPSTPRLRLEVGKKLTFSVDREVVKKTKFWVVGENLCTKYFNKDLLQLLQNPTISEVISKTPGLTACLLNYSLRFLYGSFYQANSVEFSK